MHDGMLYDRTKGQGQGQGHEASEVPKIALFKVENLSRGVDRQSWTGLITGSIARSANLLVFSLLRGRF